jgi:hypothetical protein
MSGIRPTRSRCVVGLALGWNFDKKSGDNLVCEFPSGGWQTFSQNFTANSDLTLLTFIDTRGASNAGIYLDDVSVEAVSSVPGPIAGAGLPGLIFASGGLLGWWRRRKKIA